MKKAQYNVVEFIDLEGLTGELVLTLSTIKFGSLVIEDMFKVSYDNSNSRRINEFGYAGGSFKFEKISQEVHPFDFEFFAEPYFKHDNSGTVHGFVVMVNSHQGEESFWDSTEVTVSTEKKSLEK